MTSPVRRLVRSLGLKPHPEGGFYRETWRSAGSIPGSGLPARYRGSRSYATAILFLLPAGSVSRWHRVASDELWCWQGGGPVDLAELDGRGMIRRVRIGSGHGAVLQHVVPAGRWFAARPARGSSHALVGCVVAPGFSFADFELADVDQLLARFPRSARSISAFAGAPRPGRSRARR